MELGLKCTCGHYEADHADSSGALGFCQYCGCEEFEAEEEYEVEDEDEIGGRSSRRRVRE